MIILVSIIHVFSCLTLVLVILLQAGRGGGLSDMFGGGGGGQQQKLFGTETSSFMTRLTTACAVMFIVTSIVLGILTARQSRSLITPDALKPVFPAAETPAPQKPAAPEKTQTPGDSAE